MYKKNAMHCIDKDNALRERSHSVDQVKSMH